MKETLSFLPTVPRLFPESRRALGKPLYSHRSARFGRLHRRVLEQLREVAGTGEVAVALCAGTGSFANELMVWNYAARRHCPLVVTNGEFGDRLLRQCRAANRRTLQLDFGIGNRFDPARIQAYLQNHPEIDCLLAVANESSRGMENDIAALNSFHLPIYLDGVSAVGVWNDFFQLPQVRAVSASSGKALAGLPGISILYFKDHPAASAPIPTSLDLTLLLQAQASPGLVRNTLCSMQLEALHGGCSAILKCGVSAYRERLLTGKAQIAEAFLRGGMPLLPGSDSPLIGCFQRPADWRGWNNALRRNGIEVYAQPEYLRRASSFEVAMMGDFHPAHWQRLCRFASSY